MIVTKTPLRMSFFGGGSDIPSFYENHEGLCLSTSINSYIYIALNRCTAPHLKIIYSDLEYTNNIDDIKHDRVREVLKYFEIFSNLEMCSFSDVTVKGTGLGSSSTFTVGLINALYKSIYHKTIDTAELAELASYIEIEKCGEPIGKQDQYAAAFGGLNAIYFNKSQTRVKPLKIPQFTVLNLQHNLFLFNTGITRRTSDILLPQVNSLKDGTNVEFTKSLVEYAKQAIRLLEQNKLDDFGNLLDATWVVKKSLSSGITTPEIDEMYDRAMKAGALGGKVLGAGGGGYLLVYCPEKQKNRLLETMKDYPRLNFKFTTEGSSVEMVS